jgi:hypothetical protein
MDIWRVERLNPYDYFVSFTRALSAPHSVFTDFSTKKREIVVA